MGRIFLEFFKQPQFAAVKKLVPQHILHRYTKEMSSKSEVFPLPIQFKDEKKICRCGRHLFVDYHVFHLGVTVDDKVQNYGLSLIELFIVLMQLNDTIHEGDGDRNVIKWKYLLWVFKANNKLSKYAIEGMYFLTSVKCMLTHQVSKRVIWGRGTNKKGKIGANMPNGLEMEHTIKSTKNLITSMGTNIRLRRLCFIAQWQSLESVNPCMLMMRVQMSSHRQLLTLKKVLIEMKALCWGI